MEEILIVDRIEGKLAVCERENKTTISVPKFLLPQEIKCGDYIRADLKNKLFFIEIDLTLNAKKKAIELTRSLFEN